jgi:hypothetical protein
MEVNSSFFDLITVKEIRSILISLSLKRNGNRNDLISRLISFLSTPEGRLKAYEKLNVTSLRRLYNDEDPIATFVRIYRPSDSELDILTDTPTEIERSTRSPDLRCFCVAGMMPYSTCTRCYTNQHTRCIGANTDFDIYECAFCQMLRMDPLYTIKQVIIFPFQLPRENPNFNTRYLTKNFEITAEMYSAIQESEGLLQVQVRCIKLDNIGYTHIWPKKATVVLNDDVILEPHLNSPRIDDFLNLTHLLKPAFHTLSLLKYSDNHPYAAGVFLVEIRDKDWLIAEIKKNIHMKSIEEGKQLSNL